MRLFAYYFFFYRRSHKQRWGDRYIVREWAQLALKVLFTPEITCMSHVRSPLLAGLVVFAHPRDWNGTFAPSAYMVIGPAHSHTYRYAVGSWDTCIVEAESFVRTGGVAEEFA